MFFRIFLVVLLIGFPGSLSVTCTFRLNPGNEAENYFCELIDQVVESENDLRVISGQHVGSFGNENVTAVISSNSTIRIFPSLLIDAFVNLITLSLPNVQMASFISPISNCGRLESVMIDGNELPDIPGRIFENCGRLTILNLMNNQVANVDTLAFIGLKSLIRLDLQRNRIAMLEQSVLHPMESLAVINLSSNNLGKTGIPPLLFEASANLEFIWIDHNELRNLNGIFFGNNTKLKGFSIIDNMVSNFENVILSSHTSLNEIEWSHNEIDELPAIPDLENLIRIDLNNNRVRNVTIAWNFPKLRAMSLSNNFIESIDSESFRYLAQLQHLSIANNSLTSIQPNTFANLSRLEVLILSNNKLTHITADWLVGLTVLRRLNVNNNEIVGINRDILETLPELRTFDLMENFCMNYTLSIVPRLRPSYNDSELDLYRRILEPCFNTGNNSVGRNKLLGFLFVFVLVYLI